jgi:FSR family fosmidomycin resistance protein-like MFS transporter
MTQTVDLPLPAVRATETKFVGGVCFAHFVSHYYIMLLAPLFIFVREDYGVSYTELGLALTAFNVVSTVLQTPAGFLVDRVSARLVLIAGLILGAGAFAIAGLVNSFWMFVAMFALAGVGNTVYHPADYALLSRHVPHARVGKVFSFHTFAGMLGNAAAPPTLLYMQSTMGWRAAFLGAAVLGLIAAFLLIFLAEPPLEPEHKAKVRAAQAADPSSQGWRLLLSAPILLNLVFFILLAVAGGGLNNFLVVALGALHGTTPAVANTALTGLLFLSALGVLVGGVLTGRTSRHGLVAGCGLIVTAVVVLLVGVTDPGAVMLVLLMSLSGFFSGITMPSRDMIVREVTPPGAFGRVFGFVTTGFNIGGIVSPLIFGQLLDHGHPREIFFFIAGCALLSIATVAIGTSRKPVNGAA